VTDSCEDIPLDGCFADSSESNINLANYTTALTDRVTSSMNLGYLLTDPTRIEQTKTFRTRLAANVSKYITSRYCPTTTLDDWNADYLADSAFVVPILLDCSDPTKLTNRNKSGYFYYQGS